MWDRLIEVNDVGFGVVEKNVIIVYEFVRRVAAGIVAFGGEEVGVKDVGVKDEYYEKVCGDVVDDV